MKVSKIRNVGKRLVYDISVKDVEHYVLENGAITHNTGIMLSSDQVWLVGRSQEKDGSELAGYKFTIRIEKSRYVREKSAIPIVVNFEGGMSRFAGLLDMALESGCVVKPSNGWYSRVDADGVIEAKKCRAADTDNETFWMVVLSNPRFNEWIMKNYRVSNGSLLSNEDMDAAIESA